MEESQWIERAQSAEARLQTCQGNIDRLKEDVREVMETLCAKKRRDGAIDIDFEKLVQKLSLEHALELRTMIDQHHRISGAAGKKPRISVQAVQKSA